MGVLLTARSESILDCLKAAYLDGVYIEETETFKYLGSGIFGKKLVPVLA